jgi:preprotein translocase subunit YajC
MTWQTLVVPLIEAVIFALPVIALIHNSGKHQQKTEDDINHLRERLEEQDKRANERMEKLEAKHENTLITVSGIQSCVARVESKLDLLMSMYELPTK